MLAKIQQTEKDHLATFTRQLRHSVEAVWAMLTDNEKLSLWFPELRVKDLRAGGVIQFNMPDGTAIDMKITDFNALSVLEYTWGEDLVRFELYPEPNGTKLLLKETIHKITDHTPKDLAGWHVCLDVIAALLDNQRIEDRKEVWKKWYDNYRKLVERATGGSSSG